MVTINDKAVTASSTIPTAVSRPAFSVNWRIYTVIIRPAKSGTRLVSRKSLMRAL